MKRVERKVIKESTEVVYEAADGVIFKSKEDCKKYDRRCWIEQQEVIKNRVYAHNLVGENAILFCIKNDQDFKYVKEFLTSFLHSLNFYLVDEIVTDYFDEKSGWYITYKNARAPWSLLRYVTYVNKFKTKTEEVIQENNDNIRKVNLEKYKELEANLEW